ncbi:MAG: TetR/AcrR family transcriptional regulator [Pseudomonadota bacterium]
MPTLLNTTERFADTVRYPVRANAKETFEKIVAAGQSLLDEAGLEAVNSNAVVERAGVTAPVFYHYFKHKHALLYVMASRLIRLQDEAYQKRDPALVRTRKDLYSMAFGMLRDTYDVTHGFVGASALLVSLRAVPELADIRVESNERAAHAFAGPLKVIHPELSADEAVERTRLGVEIGYSAVEMLLDTPSFCVDRVLAQTAQAVVAIYFE